MPRTTNCCRCHRAFIATGKRGPIPKHCPTCKGLHVLEIARETDERRRRAAGVKPRLHDVQQRIAARVIASASGCWLWQGHLDRHGYGTICIDGRTSGAHRVAYAAWRGPIPVGLEIDHLCREPRCVNPEHLEPVTRLENMRRRAAA